MAEKAVHLSSTKHSKPTIFELWAQDSLMSTLEPAFKTLLDVLSANNYSKYEYILKYHDEAFLALNLFLQYQYLKKYNASFSEAFYNLKRIPLTKNNFTTVYKLKSLLSVAFVPYILSKLRSIQKSKMDLNEDDKIQVLINSLFGVFNCLNFYYSVRYMVGKSRTHTFLDRLSGIEVTHSDRKDTWTEVLKDFDFRRFSSWTPFIFKLSSQTLELSAFFIQFINWWNTNESKSVGSLPVPEPPREKIAYDDSCPICSNRRKAEVVLQRSGFIFCYPCIKQYLDENNKCPVTNIPATSKDLIRLYIE